MPGLNCKRLNKLNAVYTQVSRGNVFTCTSVRAVIFFNLPLGNVGGIEEGGKGGH